MYVVNHRGWATNTLCCTAKEAPPQKNSANVVIIVSTTLSHPCSPGQLTSLACYVVQLSFGVGAGLGVRHARRQLLQHLEPLLLQRLCFLFPPLVFFLKPRGDHKHTHTHTVRCRQHRTARAGGMNSSSGAAEDMMSNLGVRNQISMLHSLQGGGKRLFDVFFVFSKNDISIT